MTVVTPKIHVIVRINWIVPLSRINWDVNGLVNPLKNIPALNTNTAANNWIISLGKIGNSFPFVL